MQEIRVRAKIQRWGNSLAVRIPKSFAAEVGLEDGSAVDLRLAREGLLIAPATEHAYDLAELLAGVTEANRHAEVDTGPAQGAEAW
jgi:antitoxin MazE